MAHLADSETIETSEAIATQRGRVFTAPNIVTFRLSDCVCVTSFLTAHIGFVVDCLCALYIADFIAFLAAATSVRPSGL